jgi:hypothetical protein
VGAARHGRRRRSDRDARQRLARAGGAHPFAERAASPPGAVVSCFGVIGERRENPFDVPLDALCDVVRATYPADRANLNV